MSFDKLLSELQSLETETETMSKALPADDGKDDKEIQAAAADGGGADGDDDKDDEGADPGAGDPQDPAGKDDVPPFGKSFTVKDADGNDVEAVDGTELVKSLMDQVGELKAQAEATEGQMAKALEQTLGIVKSQGDLIKSLSDQVKKLSGEGRGRKTVLAIAEKPAPGATMAKSEPAPLTGGELMAKALDAHKAGKLTAFEVSNLEIAVQSGVKPRADILAKLQ